MNSLVVAIVDDDDETLDLIEQILKEEGFKAQRFHSVEELLPRLPQRSFDLIFSDLMLPGASGLDLLRTLREMGLDTPFVLITGYASLDSAIEAVNKGASYYIKKPFTIEEIRFAISRVRQRQDLLQEIIALKQQLSQAGKRQEAEAPVPLMATHFAPFDLNRVLSAIDHIGRLKTSGLISDEEYVDFKGKILKRIV